jgi:hypothetical protein
MPSVLGGVVTSSKGWWFVRTRALVSAVCISVVPVVGLTALPVAAEVPAATTTAPMDADSVLVRYIIKTTPFSFIKGAAWGAIAGGPDAITDFLGEYDVLRVRAESRLFAQRDFCIRIRDNSSDEYSHHVHRAASLAARTSTGSSGRLAWNGDDELCAAFLHTGYDEALALDRALRAEQGAQAAAIAEEDRAFVRMRSETDPGPAVRVAAAWAVRPDATVDDIVEFFAYGWASGARTDLNQYRIDRTEAEASWRYQLSELLENARNAEAAAREAAEDIAEERKAEARLAWHQVADHADTAKSAWDGAEQVAERQAEVWKSVADAAVAASSPNWDAIAGPASSNQSDWEFERDNATDTAAYWNAKLDEARAAELGI